MQGPFLPLPQWFSNFSLDQNHLEVGLPDLEKDNKQETKMFS